MKIKQQQVFKPIRITLETNEEAQDFFNLIDKIDGSHCHSNGSFKVDPGEYKLIQQLSDTLTRGGVSI